MSWIDWLIVVVPLASVMWMAYSIRRYLHSVADFLVAGRICGRYLLTVANRIP